MILLDKQSEHIRLTPCEIMVLFEVMQGLSNKEIAQKLGMSVHTAKFHIQNLLQKTFTHSRTELCTKILLLLIGKPLTSELIYEKLLNL